MYSIEKLSCAIVEATQSAPVVSEETGARNFGEILEQACRLAGLGLELHQHGFGGTSVILVPIK